MNLWKKYYLVFQSLTVIVPFLVFPLHFSIPVLLFHFSTLIFLLQLFHSSFSAPVFLLWFSPSHFPNPYDWDFSANSFGLFTWQNLEIFCNIFLILEHWDRRKSMKKKKIMIPCITKRLATIEDEKKNINSTFGNKNYQSMNNNV